eukprot:278335-Chlamydomonas_euryale.AAC.21
MAMRRVWAPLPPLAAWSQAPMGGALAAAACAPGRASPGDLPDCGVPGPSQQGQQARPQKTASDAGGASAASAAAASCSEPGSPWPVPRWTWGSASMSSEASTSTPPAKPFSLSAREIATARRAAGGTEIAAEAPANGGATACLAAVQWRHMSAVGGPHIHKRSALGQGVAWHAGAWRRMATHKHDFTSGSDQSCWSCEHRFKKGGLVCTGCEKVQPVDETVNYFQLLGM